MLVHPFSVFWLTSYFIVMIPDVTIRFIRTVAVVTTFLLPQSLCYCCESLSPNTITSSDDIVNSSIEDLVAFINTKSKGRIVDPEETAKLGQAPARNSCRFDKVYSEGILAELGSIKSFQNANALAKYCGIIWNDNDSGEFETEDKRMRKAGNRYLRYYIIEATCSVINNCPECKAFHNKKYAKTRTHQHKRALALTSRKFIRLLYGLLDKGQLYSPEKSR